MIIDNVSAHQMALLQIFGCWPVVLAHLDFEQCRHRCVAHPKLYHTKLPSPGMLRMSPTDVAKPVFKLQCVPICADPTGVCSVTYPFTNGTCICNSGYSGKDCSIPPVAPVPTPAVRMWMLFDLLHAIVESLVFAGFVQRSRPSPTILV